MVNNFPANMRGLKQACKQAQLDGGIFQNGEIMNKGKEQERRSARENDKTAERMQTQRAKTYCFIREKLSTSERMPNF